MKKRRYYILLLFVFNLIACNRYVAEDVINKESIKRIDKDKELEYKYALTEATKQNILGNYKAAASLLHKCIDAYPKGDAAMFELSKIYLRFQDKANALLYAQKAIDLDSTNFWYLYNLSQMYLFFYENESAIKVYEEITQIFPSKYEIKYDLALLYYDKEEFSKALEILNILENKFGVSDDISLKKHQIYVKQDDFKNAEKEILKLINVYNDEVKYYGILAELYSNNKMDALAESFYRKIFEMDSTSGLGYLSYAEYLYNKGTIDSSFIFFNKAFYMEDVKVEYKLEILFSFISDEVKFITLNDKIYDLINILHSDYPENEQVISIMADYHAKSENIDSSIFYLKKLITLYPKNKRGWEQLFYIFNKQKLYEEMDTMCSKALIVFPEEVRYYFYKAIAEVQLGLDQEVIKTLNAGIIYVPKDDKNMMVQFYSFLGDSYYRTGSFEKSDSAFENALKYDPLNKVVLNNYSYYLSVRNVNLKKALEMSKVALKQDANSSTFLDTYAWIMFKMKKYKEAKKYIESAVEKGGDKSPTIVEHYGDILYMNDEIENALLIWKEAKRIGGNSVELDRKIETKTITGND